MENQGFPTICIEKIMIKFLKNNRHNAEEIIHGVDPKDNEDDFLEKAEKEKI